jgi:hypothetical protein
MFIRSTGLGRTLLECRVDKIEVTRVVPSTLEDPEPGEYEPPRLLMTIQTTAPVSWTVRGFVEPQDLRLILKAAMRPSVIWMAIKFLFMSGPKQKAAENTEAAVSVN